ncbi:MAG: Crp/Fnr family transcriptional regulator [Ichthyobacteriaceae bacterium]|nr:Crp/Fnr family transcriptional regulator [Ichthyobacteriaceae bacterium]
MIISDNCPSAAFAKDNKVDCTACLHKDECMLGDVIGFSHAKLIEHKEIKYSKGETIIKQGTIAPHILFVKKGMVKVYLERKDKKQVLCVENGGFIGVESIYNDKYFQYSASAVSDVVLCSLELESFIKALNTTASFSTKILKHANIRSTNLYKRIITLTQKQAHARVADVLICFAEKLFNNTEFTLPMTKKELAEMATLSVESLSRILKDYQTDNIVAVDGKNFEILDWNKLNKISDLG